MIKKKVSEPHKYMLVDLLIYTPTITAGVSIEADHYHEMFGLFTDMSCNADVCAQMLGRVRSLKDNKLNIYCSYLRKKKSVQSGQIIDQVNKVLTTLFDREVFDSFYLDLWKENKIIDNLSDNNFLSRLLSLLPMKSRPSINGTSASSEFLKEVKASKDIVVQKRAQDIIDAKDLSTEEYEEIRKKRLQDIDVSEQETA